MHTLVKQIHQLVPGVQITPGKEFYWSPSVKLITYRSKALETPEGVWALIHEAAHAKLGHQTYRTDYELLELEVAAWHEAQAMASQLSIEIDPEHVQDCLDTYRDWLHQRSTCPTCSTVCLQLDTQTYRCHNCYTSWQVSASRFCRPYRLRQTSLKQKSPGDMPQTTVA